MHQDILGSSVSPFPVLLAVVWCSKHCLPQGWGSLCWPLCPSFPSSLAHIHACAAVTCSSQKLRILQIKGVFVYKEVHVSYNERSQYLKGCWGLWIRAQSCGCTKYVAEILCALYFVFWMLPPFLPKSVKFSPRESVFWTWIAFPPRLFFPLNTYMLWGIFMCSEGIWPSEGRKETFVKLQWKK